jgi:hypothetical protein
MYAHHAIAIRLAFTMAGRALTAGTQDEVQAQAAKRVGLAGVSAAFERKLASGTPLLKMLANKTDNPTAEGRRIFAQEPDRFLDEK